MAILTLPKENLKYLDDEIIEVEIPDNLVKKINNNTVNKAKGIWKNKNIDSVKYQKEVRDEWQ